MVSGGNGGSTEWRNFPDVSAIAYHFGGYYMGGPWTFNGTSAAAPLWAGFTALIDQYAARSEVGPVGFANPVLYAIGDTRGQPGGNDLYATSLHDVADGVTNSDTPGVPGFPSVPGYDLATGWGSPACGLLQQLGSFNPIAPQTYEAILIHVTNGNDGVNDASSVTLDLRGVGGTVLQTYTLKQEGETGWADTGAEHDLQAPLPQPLRPTDIAGVTLHLLEDGQGGVSADNWDVGGIGVRLTGVNVPYACIADLSGNGACDTQQPSCSGTELLDSHTGVVRLSQSPGSSGQGPDASFDTDPSSPTNGGCPAWGGTAPGDPITQLEFLLDTSDDDLRSDSELDVAILDPNGNVLESGALHASGAPKYDNDTENSVIYVLQQGALSFAEIGSLQLTFTTNPTTCFLGACTGYDEWHAQAVQAYGVRASSGWESTCLFLGEEPDSTHPEFVFNQANGVQTLAKGSGCP